MKRYCNPQSFRYCLATYRGVVYDQIQNVSTELKVGLARQAVYYDKSRMKLRCLNCSEVVLNSVEDHLSNCTPILHRSVKDVITEDVNDQQRIANDAHALHNHLLPVPTRRFTSELSISPENQTACKYRINDI